MSKEIIFYLTAFLIFTFSLLTIEFKNIFYSLLSAVMVFSLTAIIFYLLGSEYNAVIQFAVYTFAIPVIMVIAIMFVNFNRKSRIQSDGNVNAKYIMLLFAGLFILALFYLTLTSIAINFESFHYSDISFISDYNNLKIFAKGIFCKYIYAFELISIILTIIVAGLTMFKRRV